MDPVLKSTDMVLIRIRTGSYGTTLYRGRGLSALRDKTRLFDGKLSWEEAFHTYFNVTIDPERYSVQRYRWGKKAPPIKHNLREKINVLIGEFKASLFKGKPFSVFLVEGRSGNRRSRNRVACRQQFNRPKRDLETNGDGQSQDLDEVIPSVGGDCQDLKTSFCENAKRNVTNTQFLKARHELNDLKRLGKMDYVRSDNVQHYS